MAGLHYEWEGKKHAVKFNFKTYRLLGKFWGVDGIQGLFNHVQSVMPQEGDATDISLDAIAVLSDITLAGMMTADAGLEMIDRDEFAMGVFRDPDGLMLIFNAFAETLSAGKQTKPKAKPRAKSKTKGRGTK